MSVSFQVETEKIRLQDHILNENTTKTHKNVLVILTVNIEIPIHTQEDFNHRKKGNKNGITLVLFVSYAYN
jgi:hypothetical protein